MNASPLGRDQFLTAVQRLPAEELDRVVSADDTCGLLLRMAGKSLTPADLDFLSQVAIRFVCAELDWTRCWDMPPSPDKMRNMVRDVWLRAGAKHVPAEGPWQGGMRTHPAGARAVARGPWTGGRDEAEPPPSASPLELALFWATRWNRGNVLGPGQVYLIVQHEYPKK